MNQKNLEANLKRLENIVDTLGGEDVTLEDCLKLYSEGVELSGSCMRQLEEAKQIVEQGRMQMSPEDKE